MCNLDIYSKKSFDMHEGHLMCIHAPELMRVSFAALPMNLGSKPMFPHRVPPRCTPGLSSALCSSRSCAVACGCFSTTGLK